MRKIYILLCYMMIALVSCEKDTDPFNFAPELVTYDATGIYRKGATVNGSMRHVNDCSIEEYGIMYSTFKGMEDYRTGMMEDLSDGDFTVYLTELEPGTTYYYCAYASSGYSIARGEIKEFRHRAIRDLCSGIYRQEM